MLTWIAFFAALAVLGAFAWNRSRLADHRLGEIADLRADLASAEAKATERLDQIEELRRLQGEATDEDRTLEGMREKLGTLTTAVEATKQEATKAAQGTSRIDEQLVGFTKRLANPQSRGAFGEEALRNQFELLGLKEGRDYGRQVSQVGGQRRIDYALNLRGSTIGLDPKFALDPELDELASAAENADAESLVAYGRKLISRAKDLARKEYWAHLDRSPSFVLMYVPVEGAQEAIAAVPGFSYEKFALEQGVYVVTPLQLATTLGVIADVAHEAKRAEEAEEVLGELLALDQELGKFCDQYDKHGRQLASAVVSFNAGAGMLSSRGGLGRMASRLRKHTRRRFAKRDEPQFEQVRDIGEITRSYDEAA